MHLCMLRTQQGRERVAVRAPQGILPLDVLEAAGVAVNVPENLLQIMQQPEWLDRIGEWVATAPSHYYLSEEEVVFAPPLRDPGKLWGIGLNYREHAADLDETVPELPGSFLKPSTTIIGPGDTIYLPQASKRVTGEAELALIIGRECRNVAPEQAPEFIFGYTSVIDMTAEDILRRNPRLLTRAKAFDTFFSFGPWVVTADEVADVLQVQVTTVLNGDDKARNRVANMTYPPYELVAFHSQDTTLQPGDIISTGTPGAVVLEHGDRIACRIDGLTESEPLILENPVRDLKKQ